MIKHKLKGQTMIEMLVVFFIISMGLYAAITLIFANVVLQEQDANNIVAMNMAREMLELVQNKRDSNWMASNDFDDGLLNIAGGCTMVPVWDGLAAPSFSYTASIADAAATVKRSQVVQTQGLFNNAAGTSTQFSRLLTLAPICADPTDLSDFQIPAACSCAGPIYTEKIGIRAKADVRWLRKGTQRDLTIYTDLYDWR
ncbi:type II secretion system GspH family protein [Patescibacteria group bacterium]|nr:type II secretion system GspH family protein [Patescibacteria group bacterium]